MKVKAVCLLALSFSATLSFGRLGETPEECARRYGPPRTRAQWTVDEIASYGYETNDIVIHVGYLEEDIETQGKVERVWIAHSITYISGPRERRGTGGSFMSYEIRRFLNANAQGSQWVEVVPKERALSSEEALWRLRITQWRRRDRKAIAMFNNHSGRMTITTMRFQETRDRTKDPLEGF